MTKSKKRTQRSVNATKQAIPAKKIEPPVAPEPEPTPVIKISTEEETHETFEVEEVEYDSQKIIEQFTGLVDEYREELVEMVLRHQAIRTAASQVTQITAKEFKQPIALLDDDYDEAIADVFKFMYLRNLITKLNQKFYPESPVDVLTTMELLGLTSPKEVTKQPDILNNPVVNSMYRDIKAIHKLIASDKTGVYGQKGNPNGKSTKS